MAGVGQTPFTRERVEAGATGGSSRRTQERARDRRGKGEREGERYLKQIAKDNNKKKTKETPFMTYVCVTGNVYVRLYPRSSSKTF